jgi:hypothetical protein
MGNVLLNKRGVKTMEEKMQLTDEALDDVVGGRSLDDVVAAGERRKTINAQIEKQRAMTEAERGAEEARRSDAVRNAERFVAKVKEREEQLLQGGILISRRRG